MSIHKPTSPSPSPSSRWGTLCDTLAQQSAALETTPEELGRWLTSLKDHLGGFVGGLEKSKTFTPHENESLHRWQTSVTGTSQPEELFKSVVSGLSTQGILTAGAGHLGFIPGGGLPIGAAADLIAAMVNPFSGDAFASPVAAAIHQECLETLFKMVGYDPLRAYGDLTSGGTSATLMAFYAARDGRNLQGRDYHRAVVYLGEHTHHCSAKSLDLLFGKDIQIRVIPSTPTQRMDPGELVLQIERDLKAGLKPFLLIGTAGSTNLGSVDPLADLAKIAQRHDLWFHVDGAYGGFFKLCPETEALFKGIDQADSIVLDPHKGLFLPYGLGAVLIKNRNHQRSSTTPAYLQDRMQTEAEIAMESPEPGSLPPSPMDVSFELTRPFRALRLWLALKVYGLDTLTTALREKLTLTQYLRDALKGIPTIEVIPAGDLSVTAFKVVDDPDHKKTKSLLKAINDDGRVFLTSTHFKTKSPGSLDSPGSYGSPGSPTMKPTPESDEWVIRVAILSFRTHRKTIDTTIDLIKQHGGSSL